LAKEGEVVAYGKADRDKVKWDRVETGDVVLFYHRWVYFAEARVALKTRSRPLCRHLWGHSGRYKGESHDRILLYSLPRAIHVTAEQLNRAVGYKRDYVLRPFQVVEVSSAGRLSKVLRRGRRIAARIGRSAEAARADDGVDEAIEGRQHLVEHLKRERSRKLRNAKRRDVLQRTGSLACEACGFETRKAYPWLELDFAEVHHVRPLGQAASKHKVRLDDLAILCANCHRMIHRTSPIMSVAAFRRKLS
jgi:hypothetical protein